MPAAIAITFLTAPPTSTPIRSALKYTRMRPPCSNAAASRAKPASRAASVSAQGSPRATSSANDGPDRAPQRAPAPSTCSTIWCGRSPVPGSKPLHSQTSGAGFFLRTSVRPATGVAARKRSALAGKSALTFTWGGISMFGRYRWLRRVRAIASACAGSRAHSVTSCRAVSTDAIAVPQAPAPSTATRLTGRSSCHFDLRLAARGAGLLLLLALHEQRLERHRREQHRREAAADHEIRDRLAQIGKQDRRAGDAEQRLEVVGRHVAHLENARLHRLGQEQRLVTDLRRDRGADRGLEIALGKRRRAGVDLHLELRLRRLQEDLRRVRNLERHVFHVDLLDLEGRALWLIAHLVLSSKVSSSPWRSRA